METDIQGQVLNVQGRTTKNGKTIYDIAFSDGNTYTTFQPDIATKAQQHQGQQVSARVKVEQNGHYTNFYFNDVAAAGGLPLQAQPLVAGSPVGNAGPGIAGPAPGIPIVNGPSGRGGAGGGMTPEREAKIVKQSCFSTAFGFIGSLFTGAGPDSFEEATTLAGQLSERLFNSVMGARSQQITAGVLAAQQVAQTPEAVAAEVNAELAGQPVAVGVTEEAAPPWL